MRTLYISLLSLAFAALSVFSSCQSSGSRNADAAPAEAPLDSAAQAARNSLENRLYNDTVSLPFGLPVDDPYGLISHDWKLDGRELSHVLDLNVSAQMFAPLLVAQHDLLLQSIVWSEGQRRAFWQDMARSQTRLRTVLRFSECALQDSLSADEIAQALQQPAAAPDAEQILNRVTGSMNRQLRELGGGKLFANIRMELPSGALIQAEKDSFDDEIWESCRSSVGEMQHDFPQLMGIMLQLNFTRDTFVRLLRETGRSLRYQLTNSRNGEKIDFNWKSSDF